MQLCSLLKKWKYIYVCFYETAAIQRSCAVFLWGKGGTRGRRGGPKSHCPGPALGLSGGIGAGGPPWAGGCGARCSVEMTFPSGSSGGRLDAGGQRMQKPVEPPPRCPRVLGVVRARRLCCRGPGPCGREAPAGPPRSPGASLPCREAPHGDRGADGSSSLCCLINGTS